MGETGLPRAGYSKRAVTAPRCEFLTVRKNEKDYTREIRWDIPSAGYLKRSVANFNSVENTNVKFASSKIADDTFYIRATYFLISKRGFIAIYPRKRSRQREEPITRLAAESRSDST